MNEPKVKPIAQPPKVLERTVRTVNGVKNGLSKSAKTAHEVKRTHQKLTEQMSGQEKFHRPEEYMTNKAAEKTEYAARKAGGKITGKANETIRNRIKKATEKQAKKGVNASKRTTRATKKIIKTTKKGVKAAAKTAQKSAKAARKAAVAAKKTAVLAAKIVKAVIAAVKATFAAVKGLLTIIAAGGWIVIVIILIIAVIMLVVSSPFGAFANESDGETPTLSEVVQEINGEYTSAINKIIIDAGEIDEIIIEGETASSGYSPTNWIDVLAVFSVKSTINDNPDEYMDVAIMDTEKIEALKDIFWQMNSITYEIEEEPVSTTEPMPNPTQNQDPTEITPTPEPTPEVIRTLYITMASKTYIQGSDIYDFTDEQYKVLEEMMSPQHIAMYMELCGMDTFHGLTPEQLSRLIKELPEGELGSVIVEYALTRIGHPYSRQLRGQGNYVDCSYFARWCYQQAGVSHFTAGTAAEQARYCVNNNLCISKSDLQIGDLIFWSFHTNGRFMDITHVGIYAGNGYVIDASSYRGMVVYRPIFGESSIVVCGRPHVLD